MGFLYSLSIKLICWQLFLVMLVMSCPSTTNEPESCSSEGSRCTTSFSTTTSDLSSMSGQTHCSPPSLSDASNTSKHQAPPPPPLPPPPPGAPPPPPATTSTNHNTRKKRRVRSFFWKPIPEEKVRGKPNIWTLAVRQQQQYQIDVRSVEELFGQQEEATTGVRGQTQHTGTSTRVSRSRSFKESGKDEVCEWLSWARKPIPATWENVCCCLKIKKEVESSDINFTLALLWEVVIFSVQGLPKSLPKVPNNPAGPEQKGLG